MNARRALPLFILLAACGREVEVFPGGSDFGPFPGRFDGEGRIDSTDPVLVLGQVLFFDRELSGNRNISCATCHIPFLQTTEGIPLSMGQGATGIGPNTRRLAEGVVLPRNTTDLFNRSAPDATALFWDGRVELGEDGQPQAPVDLPPGIVTLLQAQALLPMLDRDEMRGHAGDVDAQGVPNELAMIPDDDPDGVWDGIIFRLGSNIEYRVLFQQAFPESGGEPRIDLVARAIEHFENTLWDVFDSRLDLAAPSFTGLTEEEARGQRLFVSDAGCSNCHSGSLMSDQGFHNIGVPQLGPGKNDDGLDEGRFLVTDDPADRFAFRTPALRNVRLTAPYMHNGAFATLDAAVRHHLNAEASLRSYGGASLSDALREQIHDDPETLDAIMETLDPDLGPTRPLDESEISALVAFLHTLDSQSELLKGSTDGVPDRVPSGLPVDRWPGGAHPSR